MSPKTTIKRQEAHAEIPGWVSSIETFDRNPTEFRFSLSFSGERGGNQYILLQERASASEKLYTLTLSSTTDESRMSQKHIALSEYMKMVDNWASAFDEEAAAHSDKALSPAYDDAYFEALELQKQLP